MKQSVFQVKVKELRIKSGYKSQQSFADFFGVAQSTVGSWESGSREPDFNTLLKLADLFGVSTDYLLGRQNNNIDFDLQKFAEHSPQKITAPEQQLLAAYHNAPQPIRDAVDGLLAPYAKQNPAASEHAAG